jgi:hypothetical protein
MGGKKRAEGAEEKEPRYPGGQLIFRPPIRCKCK